MADRDTRQNWECPFCCWSGRGARLNLRRWEVECPECGGVINDDIAEQLEEHSDWSRTKVAEGSQ